ncbi:MAG TPA: PKD domain-containing protein, partial [Acidobacteriota bacterium]|nr:PKD domain-containing protein [Acidobacteriota bacterium]
MKRIFLFLIAVCLIAGCQSDMGTGMKDSQSAMAPASPQAQVSPAAAAAAVNAAFSMSPKTGGDVNTSFKFNASASTGSITKFSWNFGDGSSASGKTATHKFKDNGTFTIKLTVSGNGGAKDTLNKHLDVGKAGGGSGGGKCTNPAPNRGFIYGTVVGVQGLNAIVRLPAGSTCANSFYNCGDMRRASPEQFRGIIHGMSDLGNGTFSIFNDCPF